MKQDKPKPILERSTLSRRHFLITAGSVIGGWMIPGTLARQIVNAAQDYNEIVVPKIVKPTDTLYFGRQSELFYLGIDPDKMHDEFTLTWGEYLDIKGIDPKDRQEVKEYLENYGFRDPEEGPFKMPKLKDLLPDHILEHYLEWGYAINDSPEAQAYDYLQRLDLGEALTRRGNPMGSLEFCQGPYPGSNFTYVGASGLEVVSGLQHRLLEIGEDVEIVLLDC